MDEIVNFPDKNLELKIRKIINKAQGDIFRNDCLGVLELHAQDSGIFDLSGLENLVNLEILALYKNRIVSIKQLEGLTNLKELWIGSNEIEDISPLKNLHMLKGLGLVSCKISDINSLKNLVGLETLELYNNNISDIYVLSEMIKLKKLDLNKNRIECIDALIFNAQSGGLTKDAEVFLSDNSLNDKAKDDITLLTNDFWH